MAMKRQAYSLKLLTVLAMLLSPVMAQQCGTVGHRGTTPLTAQRQEGFYINRGDSAGCDGMITSVSFCFYRSSLTADEYTATFAIYRDQGSATYQSVSTTREIRITQAQYNSVLGSQEFGCSTMTLTDPLMIQQGDALGICVADLDPIFGTTVRRLELIGTDDSGDYLTSSSLPIECVGPNNMLPIRTRTDVQSGNDVHLSANIEQFQETTQPPTQESTTEQATQQDTTTPPTQSTTQQTTLQETTQPTTQEPTTADLTTIEDTNMTRTQPIPVDTVNKGSIIPAIIVPVLVIVLGVMVGVIVVLLVLRKKRRTTDSRELTITINAIDETGHTNDINLRENTAYSGVDHSERIDGAAEETTTRDNRNSEISLNNNEAYNKTEETTLTLNESYGFSLNEQSNIDESMGYDYVI